MVQSPRAWVFLAVGAADRGVPRWLLVQELADGGTKVTGPLDDVAATLRERLGGEAVDLGFDERAAAVLGRALTEARRHKLDLLPIRKRRALEEMAHVLEAYRGERGADPERIRVVGALLELLESGPRADVDVERLASWWLQLVRQPSPLASGPTGRSNVGSVSRPVAVTFHPWGPHARHPAAGRRQRRDLSAGTQRPRRPTRR